MRAVFLLLIALIVQPPTARADTASTSYLTILAHDRDVDVTWSLALLDLEDAVGLDTDGDGQITWGELRARAGAVGAYALPRLRFTSAGAACVAGEPVLLVNTIAGAGYAVLRYTARCPVAIEQLDLTYAALFEIDPRHRGLVNLMLNGVQQAAVLSPEQPTARFGAASGGVAIARQFFAAGIAHLLGGADHLLFIVMLLTPALLRPDAAHDSAARLLTVVKLLTAFTVAHAVTLTLAVLGLFSVSPAVAEPAIALTILVTAIDNIRPFLPARRSALALGFGLIHGLSVAGGLGPLDLPPATLALALVSFNLGLEAAQILIAILTAPIGYCLRATRPASLRVLPTLSSAAAAIALLWFSQRMEQQAWHLAQAAAWLGRMARG